MGTAGSYGPKYMTTVLQEEPVDPTLVDFDDSMAW